MNLTNIHGTAPSNGLTVGRMPFDTVENTLACREFMKRPNLSTIPSPALARSGTAPKMAGCARSLGTARTLPPHRTCPRPNRVANRPGDFGLGDAARKFLLPCVGALVFGKALAYCVEFFALILFLLR